jgi:hypothetical protein
LGKGFGDLPDLVAWLRPLTISATAAVAMPTDPVGLTTTARPIHNVDATQRAKRGEDNRHRQSGRYLG